MFSPWRPGMNNLILVLDIFSWTCFFGLCGYYQFLWFLWFYSGRLILMPKKYIVGDCNAVTYWIGLFISWICNAIQVFVTHVIMLWCFWSVLTVYWELLAISDAMVVSYSCSHVYGSDWAIRAGFRRYSYLFCSVKDKIQSWRIRLILLIAIERKRKKERKHMGHYVWLLPWLLGNTNRHNPVSSHNSLLK